MGSLPNGFYGLDTMLLEGVLRALAGEPRAEGAARVDPVALGRVLGLDRAPEVKTIRRKIAALAETGQAEDLLAAMARHHVAGLQREQPDLPDLAAVLYVDGHVRAYQGTRKIAKTHLSRLRFPAPATLETWVSDAAGDPVLVVMAEPAASLAVELRRLTPSCAPRSGTSGGSWSGSTAAAGPRPCSPTCTRGFDTLTWRKTAPGRPRTSTRDRFTDVTYIDETGRPHAWTVADTTVAPPH